jgi:peptidoglycan hydrolase-like protein with peptidoglycan-binding domain
MGRPHPQPVAEAAEMALAQRGFNPGEIDGNLDENAREALKRFQRDANLEVTGTLNQATARALGVDLNAGDQQANARQASSRDEQANMRQRASEDPLPYETIRPDISAPGTSNAGTQSARTGPSDVPLPQGSPFAGTVEMRRAHPAPVAKAAEMALAQRGFNPGVIDGNLDENAREALKNFQRDAQLEVTGTLNQATARELGVDLRGNERADFGQSDRR